MTANDAFAFLYAIPVAFVFWVFWRQPLKRRPWTPPMGTYPRWR